ncbi:MAG: hypothetical protein GX222_08215 [Ruminococcaceae bacterium]|nr:hypothetical protein [Oscillospiraceae bacterium]
MNNITAKLKIFFITATLVVVCILVSGCSSLYDNSVGDNIGSYVDPVNNAPEKGDYLPEENAKSDGKADIEDNIEIEDGDGSSSRITEPNIIDDRFVSDNFSFYVPSLWRKSMQLEKNIEEINGYEILSYVFYYVSSDETEAVVMTLKEVPYDVFTKIGTKKDWNRLGDISKDKPVFFILSTDEPLPEDFVDVDAYLEIYNMLNEKLDFKKA